MIPVRQKTPTDCLRASVASLLELPLEEVPPLPPFASFAKQLRRVSAFVESRGLAASVADPWRWRDYRSRNPFDPYWLGMTPTHVLVMEGDTIAFDPAGDRVTDPAEVIEGLFLLAPYDGPDLWRDY